MAKVEEPITQYCRRCGAKTAQCVPPGDNRFRDVCLRCGEIHYANPKIVAGCILEWHEHILLCRRAIEPRYGFWTLPAGFMENGESTLAAAAREAREEANAVAEQLELHGLYNLIRINQVYLIYRGRLAAGYACSGDETLEIGLFKPEEIPYDQLAFSVMTITLKHYFLAKARGEFSVQTVDIP